MLLLLSGEFLITELLSIPTLGLLIVLLGFFLLYAKFFDKTFLILCSFVF